MTIRRISVLIATLGGVGAASACTMDSPTNISVVPPDADDAGVSASSLTGAGAAPASGGACSGAFIKPDLSKLTACGDGKGHCYDKDKTPLPEAYNACPDATQLCIPDKVLTAGGGTMKSCSSVIGKGGCINPKLLVVPDEYKANMSLLKQDVCDADELCAPCNDPTHGNAPLPFCQPSGVYDKPCTASAPANGGDGGSASAVATALATCCAGSGTPAGICMVEDAVPEAGRGRTVQESCKSGEQCVPQAFVPGQGTPKTCSGRLGAAGICIDQCFSTLFELAGPLVGNDGCGASEVCMPCRLLDVAGMTVPGCS